MIRQVSREGLVKMRELGQDFKLVDVLAPESYAQEHIAGAISIPLADIDKKAKGLLKTEDTVVVYCASFECTASTKAAEKLVALGYKNVLDYKGGLKDYKQANLPLKGRLHEQEICPSCCACD